MQVRTRIPRLASSRFTNYRTPRQSSLAWLGVRNRTPRNQCLGVRYRTRSHVVLGSGTGLGDSAINKPKLIFDLHSGKKSETSPIIMKSNFQELKSQYMDYKHIYTDGSKDDMKAGCAVVSDDFSFILR